MLTICERFDLQSVLKVINDFSFEFTAAHMIDFLQRSRAKYCSTDQKALASELSAHSSSNVVCGVFSAEGISVEVEHEHRSRTIRF